MKTVFNIDKTPDQYRAKSPLFFGTEPGLFDTVNKHYPEMWTIYKTMKSLDWDEEEFDYLQCNQDFKTCPPEIYQMMIRTLAWQWEADSVASRSIAPILAPFISDTSLWAACQRISDNEVIHAATYSEIVRLSFDNPEDVMRDVLAVKESLDRLHAIGQVFAEGKKASHEYALGLITADEAYDKMLMIFVALLLLERVQFMASFAITFTICGLNFFIPIGKAVQKVAQDELEVHVQFDKTVLRIELATERGRRSFERQKPRINALFHEVVNNELGWTENLFSEGRELAGATVGNVKKFVLFNAKDVAKFLDIDTDLKFPATNPMPHIDDWMSISKTQAAPQEQDNNQYKVNIIIRDDDAVEFDQDF